MTDIRFNRARFAQTFLLIGGLAFVSALFMPTASVAAHGDAKTEGAQVFANSGCQHCHGAAGEGTNKGPGLQDVPGRMSEEQVKEQIKHGGKSMPAFADSLDDAQLENLVKFLRAKKRPQIPPTTAQ